MDLKAYLEGKSHKDFAAQIGVVPILVSQWKLGVRRVPAEHCPEIERVTGGLVRCEELRPDVNWAVLRRPCDGQDAA